MAKHKVECINCKNSIEIILGEQINQLSKIKGVQGYYPLLKELSQIEWDYGYFNGLSMRCKCGTPLYLIGSLSPEKIPALTSTLPPGYLTAGFCNSCSRAFVSNAMSCPYCTRTQGGLK
ncbi:hypothetical protein EU527_07705 [Candidatus Thorarchaeota archaeon]|nr:MAG: hypothetical protein EU527_07705 [Candidatus Thorarchaeota archaeon]